MVKRKHIIFGSLFIIFDISIYVLLGQLLMHYEDTYDITKGEFWSLSSMSHSDKIVYIGINIWNLLNVIFVGYILYNVIKSVIKARPKR